MKEAPMPNMTKVTMETKKKKIETKMILFVAAKKSAEASIIAIAIWKFLHLQHRTTLKSTKKKTPTPKMVKPRLLYFSVRSVF
jgi:hypothetical protein